MLNLGLKQIERIKEQIIRIEKYMPFEGTALLLNMTRKYQEKLWSYKGEIELVDTVNKTIYPTIYFYGSNPLGYKIRKIPYIPNIKFKHLAINLRDLIDNKYFNYIDGLVHKRPAMAKLHFINAKTGQFTM